MVVDGAPVRLFVTEPTVIVVIGIILSVVGVGILCWLLFTLAVYALPLFAAVSAGLWAHETGAGILGAGLVGLAAGALVLIAAAIVFATVRSIWIRLAVALLFAVPAAIAGYHATHGLMKLTAPSEAWQIAFSIVGAVVVGVTAWTGLAIPSSGGTGHRAGSTAVRPAQGRHDEAAASVFILDEESGIEPWRSSGMRRDEPVALPGVRPRPIGRHDAIIETKALPRR